MKVNFLYTRFGRIRGFRIGRLLIRFVPIMHDNLFGLRAKVTHMGGSQRTTTYHFKYTSSWHDWELSFCWRHK